MPAGSRVVSAADLCRSMLGGQVDDAGMDRCCATTRRPGCWKCRQARDGMPSPAWGSAFGDGTVGDAAASKLRRPGWAPDGPRTCAALTLVTADGELRRASRERSPELFRLAIGGFGVFGPFYSVTLDLASLAQAAAAAAAPVRLELPEADAAGGVCSLDLLVPPQASEALVGRVRRELEERRYALTELVVRRTLAQGETFLRPAPREFAALRIELRSRSTLGGSVGATQLRAQSDRPCDSRRVASSRRQAFRRQAARRPPPATRCWEASSPRSGASIPPGGYPTPGTCGTRGMWTRG